MTKENARQVVNTPAAIRISTARSRDGKSEFSDSSWTFFQGLFLTIAGGAAQIVASSDGVVAWATNSAPIRSNLGVSLRGFERTREFLFVRQFLLCSMCFRSSCCLLCFLARCGQLFVVAITVVGISFCAFESVFQLLFGSYQLFPVGSYQLFPVGSYQLFPVGSYQLFPVGSFNYFPSEVVNYFPSEVINYFPSEVFDLLDRLRCVCFQSWTVFITLVKCVYHTRQMCLSHLS